MTTKKVRSHEEALISELSDPREAAAYLSAALEENDYDTFLLALKRVAQAQGISKLAQDSDINRQHLYKALSEGGNPTLRNLMAILFALQFTLKIKPKKRVG